MSKEIAIIGTVGLPAQYGGFETLAENITQYLGNEYKLTIYCSSLTYNNKLDTYNGARLVYIPLNANGVQSIFYDLVSLLNAMFYADIFLILGVSGCIGLPLVKLFSRKKIIVNIDGLEWKREKWNIYAKWFLKFSEKMAVKYSDVVISDNRVIQNYVLRSYGIKSELIAYGADHAKKVKSEAPLLQEFPFLKNNYAFSVCRIEPENNLHIIIYAMSQQKNLDLVIVGNWDASQYGIDLKREYADQAHIHLIDPIYEQTKLNQIRSGCFFYIHGHSAGGTNPSLVEAMYLRLPVVAFDVDYNKETTENKALYFNSSNDLLELILNLDEVMLADIAKEMRTISEKRYKWEIVAKQYEALF